MSDYRNTIRKPTTPSLTVAWKVVLLAFAWLVIVPSASTQKTPENGEKIALGSAVTAPCSCEGNLCSLWPPPKSGTFPRGFQTAAKKITSFIQRGEMVQGQWQAISGVGGATVTEQWQGGKCVKVNGAGGRTDEPAPAIFSITYPGTYRLRIERSDWAAIYDCRNPACSFSKPHVLKSEVTSEDRYFTTEAPPKPCDCSNLAALRAELSNAVIIQQNFRDEVSRLRNLGRIESLQKLRDFAERDASRGTHPIPGDNGPSHYDYKSWGDALEAAGRSDEISRHTARELCRFSDSAADALDAMVKALACPDIGRAVRAHEDVHVKSCERKGYLPYFNSNGADLAEEEVEAYEAEIRALRAAIASLSCPGGTR